MSTSVKKDILPCAILLAFWCYLFRGILSGHHFLYGNDFNAFYFGMKQFLFTEIHRHHSIPYWNPYIFGGIPFWAHFESTIFYPLGFLFWTLPPSTAYGYTVFVHLVLAAILMYALARALGIGRAGSFVAGAVFSCNGFITALLYLGHLSPVMSYPWLPLVILFLHRSLDSGYPFRNAALAGFFWGIQILAGAPQDAFYTFGAAFLLGLSHMITRPYGSSPVLRPILCLFLLFLVGVSLSAIQVIPALEFVRESVRSALDSFPDVTSRSLPWQGLITAIAPGFFWDPASNSTWLQGMPYSMPQENIYIGILPLLLLFFISRRALSDKRFIPFAFGLAALGLLLALGHNTPLYKIAYLVPGFDKFRSPTRILVLWVFAMALWAGKGMDLISSGRLHSFKGRTVAGLGILLVFIAADVLIHFDSSLLPEFFSPFILAGMAAGKMPLAVEMIGAEIHRFTLLGSAVLFVSLLIQRRSLQAKAGAVLLCGLLLMDLGMIGGRAIQYDDRFERHRQAAQHALDVAVGPEKPPFRVGSFASPSGPNFEMALGYQTVGGFTALFPERYYEYINAYSEGGLPRTWQYWFYGRRPHKVLMDLLNVKYEIHWPEMQFVAREGCLPRAFLVTECAIRPREEVLPLLTRPDFDPTGMVVLEEGDCSSGRPARKPSSPAAAETEVLSYRPDEIRISVHSPQPGYLFLSEMYYPGWKAFVDGAPVRVLRGDYLFRVIGVSEGKHLVRMVFQPWSIRVGTGITLLALFSLALFSVTCLVRDRRRNCRGSSLGRNLKFPPDPE